MKKKTLGIVIVSVLGAAAIFCSAMFTHQYLDAQNSKVAFDDLTNLIAEIDEPQKDTEAEESGLSEEELAAAEAALAHEKYDALFAQNNDFIGWIRIDGTNVNYPVMQTPNKPDFYLKRSFDKTYSDYGVPYIDEACMTGISNNLVIYGHHMNDGSMFADLCKYTDADFCREHPTIALFAVDVSEVERKNPYQEFEALVRRDGWNKIYSLHRLPLPGNQEKADILRNETKLYLNQACRKDKTAIPSDWCIYCVHRENCMESFLRSEVGMSSSRNEPCINRSVRANAPVKNTFDSTPIMLYYVDGDPINGFTHISVKEAINS